MVYYADDHGLSQQRASFFTTTGIVFQRKKCIRITLPMKTTYLAIEADLLFEADFSGDDAMTKSGK